MFLGWNMPNHYPPFPSFHGELLAAGGLLFIALGLGLSSARNLGSGQAMVDRAKTVIPISAPVLILALAGLVPVAQFLGGMLLFRADAAFGLLYGMGAAVAVYAGQLWAARNGREEALTSIFLTFVFGGLASNAFALAQWLRLPALGWWATELIEQRPFGNFAQSNHFGLMMVLSIVAATALFELRVLRSSWVYSLVMAFFGWGVLISQSRAAVLAFLSIVVFWFCTRRRVGTRLRPMLVLLAVGFWALTYLNFERLQVSMYLNARSLHETLEGGVRPAMWKHFLTAIVAQPWGGYGFNQGVAAMAEVATLLAPSETRSTQYAHNFILDLMVWGGVPLALALIGALVYGLIRGLRLNGDSGLAQHRYLVLAAVLALLLQSCLEYPYAYAYFLLPVALLVGMVTSSNTREAGPANRKWFVPSMLASGGAVVTFLLLAAVVWDYSKLEEDFRVARFMRAKYIGVPHHDFLESPVALDFLAAMNRTALRQLSSGMNAAELDEMRRVARRVQNPAVQMDYAKALALNGRMTEAEHELAILRSLYSPSVFAAIKGEWTAWLESQQERVLKSAG